jgi:hypothetical protein
LNAPVEVWLPLVLGVACALTLLLTMPRHAFDDRALMTPMELPDDEMLAALREVDEIAPAAPRVGPLRLELLIPPAAGSAEVYPHGLPPRPRPTSVPGPGILASR